MPLPLRTFAAVAAASIALTGCQPVQDAFGKQVRAYLLEHPEVLQEAAEKLQEKKLAEAHKAVGAAIDAHRAALERDPRDFVANPNGKITVVEFFDYRCGYCKVAAPEILDLIAKNPDVRFVFKELPIFGGESTLAAQVALSEAGRGKTLALYGAFMGEKALDEAAIERHLKAVGVDPAAARAGGATPGVQKHLQDTHQLAANLNIEGTPAFVVGGKLIPGADIPALQQAIAETRAAALKGAG